jgi:replication factor C large subunit
VGFPEKYEPKTTADIVGQSNALSEIKEWLHKPRKGLLAYGPPGTGKTATAYALAREYDLEIVEMNASDFRRGEDVQQRLLNAALQKSLWGKRKLILVDEVDGLAGRADSGAVNAIAELIRRSAFPVYLTCNDNWSKNIRELKGHVKEVKFEKPRMSDVVRLLQAVAAKEDLKVERTVLLHIAGSRDIRSALSDLETLTAGGKEIGELDLEVLGNRDRGKTIFEALRDIFKAREVWQARLALEGLDTSVDEVMMWLDENIAREYSGDDVSKAYEALSRADVFRGRIVRRQDWKLLKYVIDMSTVGVAMAKSKGNYAFTSYRPSRYIVSMGRSRMTRAARKGLLEKIGRATHSSRKTAGGYLPVIAAMAGRGVLPFQLDQPELDLLG